MLRRNGFTLVELMLSVAIGAAFLTSAITFMLTLGHSMYQIQQQLTLESELRLLTQTLTLQLSRAGYVASSHDTSTLVNQLALNGTLANIHVGHHPNAPQHSCVLFAYDKNKDGAISLASPSEHFGFRLNNKALEFRVARKSCEASGWHDITDTRKTYVSAFEIKPKQAGQPAWVVTLTLQSAQQAGLTSSRTFLISATNAHPF